MKSIKLTNETHYLSRDLTKLFTLILKDYKRWYKMPFSTYNVTCIYRKISDGFCGGSAYLKGNCITMKLPKEKKGYNNESFERNVTRTFLHELDHCRGLRHGAMISDDMLRDLRFLPDTLIVKERVEKEKQKKTPDSKLQNLLKRKKVWSSKLSRCETAIKKINKQIKYYEKKKQNHTESV